MTRHRRHLLAACAALALAVAGCGSSDEPEGAKLPPSSVAQLNQRLDEIQRRFDDARDNHNPGACEDIQTDSFAEVKRLLDALPEDVDGELREATVNSFARLQQLTEEGCQDIQPTETETETTPTETAPHETVPPETTPAETTPPETTPRETTPERTTPPDEQGGNGGTDPDGTGGGGVQAPEGDG